MVSTPIDMLLFALKHIAFVMALCLFSYAVGWRSMPQLVYHSISEKIVFSIGLGLGLIALLVFLAGIAGLLRVEVLVAGSVLMGLLCFKTYKELPNDLRVIRRKVTSRPRILLPLLIIGLLLIPAVILALYPPTAFDATMSHLPLVKQYLRNQRISPAPYLRWSVLPQINHMLFALAMILFDDISAQFIQFLLTVLTGLALFGWGARHYTESTGLWAGVLWLSHPMVIFVGTSAYIDVGLTFFVVLSSYAIFNWISSGDDHWLVLAAIFGGFAAGSKYAGLFFMGLFGLVTLIYSIRRRWWSPPFIYSAIAVCAAAPWYVYNYYHTGNPVFPFMGDLFGYSFWTAGDVSSQMTELVVHGMGRSLESLLLLPWNLTVHQHRFLLEAPYFPSYFLLLPAVLYGLRSASIRLLFVVVTAYVIFWFNSAQVLRYLLPVVPLLSLLTASAAVLVLSRLRLARRVKQAELVTLVVMILTILPGSVYAAIQVNNRGWVPADKDGRDAYLSRQLIQYSAIKYLNEQRPEGYTLYTFISPRMAYFADGEFRGDWFGNARFAKILDGKGQSLKLMDGQELYEALRSLKVTHLLITSPYSKIAVSPEGPGQKFLAKVLDLLKIDSSRKTRRLAKFEIPRDDFFQTHFRLVYARAYANLFELVETPLSAEVGEEKLRNRGFEGAGDLWASFWEVSAGTERVINSHNSSIAASCRDNASCLSQTVEIEGGGIYRLSNLARSLEDGAEMVLGFNWIDKEGRVLQTDREYFAVQQEWRGYALAATAPELAVAARIVTAAVEERTLLVDEFSLTRVGYRPGQMGGEKADK